MTTKIWTGGGTISKPKSGNWGTSSNWSPSGAPVGGDDVVFGGSGNYTVSLNLNSALLNSLTINDAGAILAVRSSTLSIGGNGANAINLAAGQIQIVGGTINDAGGMFLASGTLVSGAGKLNIAGQYTGSGTLLASGGTLDVFGTVASGVVLQISSSSTATLKIEGVATAAAAIAISGNSQTLEVGAAGNLTINAAESITKGTIKLDGGTLKDAAGLVIGSGATLAGFGTVTASLSGSGAIQASGGVLDLTGSVSVGPALRISSASASTLKIDGAAIVAGPISISSVNQTLEVGANGNLTLNQAQSFTNGTIKLDGGTLTDSKGITVGAGATLIGSGVVAAALGGTGTIKASGGTLDLRGAVSGGPILAIDALSASTLKIEGTATAANAISISNANQTLEIGPAGKLTISQAENFINGTIKLDGGMLTDTKGITVGAGAKLVGSGVVAANLGGSGTITASNGTLDLTGTVTSGVSLAIDSASLSRLKIDSTATAATAIAINSANQTLEIGSTGRLTILVAESITNGKIQLDGGSILTDAAGVTIGAGATLTGSGTAGAITLGGGTITQSGGALSLASITGFGTVTGSPTVNAITASGGLLDFKAAIDTLSISNIHIANLAGSDLKFEGVVGTASIHPVVTFDGTNGGAGILDLSATTLANFKGVVANFGNSEAIKVTNAASLALDATGKVLTVFDGGGHSLGAINFAASYTGYKFSVANGVISVSDAPVIAHIGDGGVIGGSEHIVTNQPGDNTVTGTAVAGSTVTLSYGNTVLGQATVDSAGSWTYALTAANISAIGQGANKTITAVDTHSGFVSASTSSFDFAVNTITVSISAITDSAVTSGTDGQLYINAAHFNGGATTLSGTADVGDVVTVSINGNPAQAASVDGSGYWTLNVSGLTDGQSVSAIATATNASGSAQSLAFAFKVDTSVTESAISDGAVTTGTDGKFYINAAHFNGGTTTLTGTADVGDSVMVSINGAPAQTANVDASGHWSLAVNGLTNGENVSAVATATDPAGNTAQSAAFAFAVDTSVSESAISDISVTTGTDAALYINAAHFAGGTTTLTGAADVGDTVLVSINGGAAQAANVDASGHWSLAISGLTNGESISAVATATDPAGNTAQSPSFTFTVDTAAPDAPSIGDGAVQGGYVNAANDTLSQVLTGTAEAGSTINIYLNGSAAPAFTATADSGGNWSQSIGHLADGSFSYAATATDAAGNTGPASAALDFIVDTAAPAITFDGVSFTDTGTLGDHITNNGTVTLSGTIADSNGVSQVQVFNGQTLLETAAVDNASHSWTLTADLAQGNFNQLNATAIDMAGNSSAASTAESVQVDTSAPHITFDSVTLTNPSDPSGTVTTDGGVTLSGTISDNAGVGQIQIFNGAALLSTVANPVVINSATGTWSFTILLDQGTYNQLHATAIDVAGNTSDAATSKVVTVSAASGYVIDGYISGATVFADGNGDGILDNGEASGLTDDSGHFVLGAGTTSGPLVMTGGTDTATGVSFTGVLTAPSGSTQVTPLTTLVQAVAASNGGDVAAASQAVASVLGIDPSLDLTSLDTVAAAYTGDSQAFVAASSVLNTVTMIASAVAGTGADFSTAASSAFSAIAAQITVAAAGNTTLDLASASVVSSTLASVATGSSADLTSEQIAGIVTVVTSVNTATAQAAADAGSDPLALLTNVSATSIVAQGSASSQLQDVIASNGDIQGVVDNNSGASLDQSVTDAAGTVGNIAPAPPVLLGLTPTDAATTNAAVVHYLLSFSGPVQGIDPTTFHLEAPGLPDAFIASVAAVPGSNGTQWVIAVNTGTGDGTIALTFVPAPSVADVANNPLGDQTPILAQSYTIDHDAGEQAALSLAISKAVIDSTGAASFQFTVGGVESDDSGQVIFTDGPLQKAAPVLGAQTNYTAALNSLTDGTITDVLALNPDPAGNPFAPVAGNSPFRLNGVSFVNGTIVNSGSIEAISGTLDLTGLVSGSGSLKIDDGATLELAGATAQTVTFAGGSDTLQLDNVLGFSGTIGGVSASGGTFTITGPGNVTTSSGDAIDFTASGGTIGSPANVVVTPSGTLTGAASGIVMTQNGVGDLTVNATGLVAGQFGNGILVQDSATGSGNISITATGGASASGTTLSTVNGVPNTVQGFAAIRAQNLDSANDRNVSVTASGAINASGYGIRAQTNGVGSITVTTNAATINAGSAGISAVNLSTSIAADKGSTITVTNYAPITSGTVVNASGSAPRGLDAGYFGANATANQNINGTVLVNNYANVTALAAGSTGVNAYNYGNGNVTLNEGSGTIVTAGFIGLGAFSLSGGTGNVTVTVGANATITGTTNDGIQGYSLGSGNISVTTSAGDTITGGRYGILALDQGTNVVAGKITVNAVAGTTIHGNGASGIQAGYSPVVPAGQSPFVTPNVHGDVEVNSSATITGIGNGINAFNWGTGNVTVQTGASSITATGSNSVGINASTNYGGSVSVTNAGTATGVAQGINANVAANPLAAGTLSVTNSGTASGTTGAGIRAFDLAGGNVSISNSGSTTGTNGINASSSGAGSITIDNTGHATATNGQGINANASGSGNVTVTAGVASIISATNGSGINGASGSGNVTVTTGLDSIITATASNASGINVSTNNGGNASVTNNHLVTSGGNGISAFVAANAIHAGTLSVTNNGGVTGLSGSGINANDQAGGNVTVTNTGLATGNAGITAFATGTGTITIDNSGTASVFNPNPATGAVIGINATASDGDIEISNSGSVLGLVFAIASGAGSVSIDNAGSVETLANGIVANANGSGSATITNAVNSSVISSGVGLGATTSGAGTASITNNGTVTSTSSSAVAVNATAAGNATIINTGTVTGLQGGIGASANGGNVSITSGGAVSGQTGISVNASGAGNVTITNSGQVTGTNFAGVNVFQNNGATGSLTITNAATGAISGTASSAAIAIGALGTVAINNAGVISSNAAYGAVNEQGSDVAVTNTGTITGNISIGNGTIDNAAGGVWSVGSWSGMGFSSTTGIIQSNTITNEGTINLSSNAYITAAHGLVVNNAGTIDAVSGPSTIDGSVANTGAIEVSGGTLYLSGQLSGSGSLKIDDGATLELAGATAQTVTFAGGVNTLQLDNLLGFSGTIAGVSSSGGTFTVTGAGNITAANGDALDFTASGGMAGSPGNVVVTPSGTLTSAAAGLVVTQNGVGDISVNATGLVSGQAGDGIKAQDSATGSGNISIMATGGASASGASTPVLINGVSTPQGYAAIRAQNLDASNGGDITISASGTISSSQYGIRAQTAGTGKISVATDSNTTINSAGAGINVVSFGTNIPVLANSLVTVVAHGTINSGSMLNASGSQAQGISAGYYGAASGAATANPNVKGTVGITSDAQITAAGYGINAFNYGNGNVTVNETGGSIHASGFFGINAISQGIGNIDITTAAGVTIDSNSTGINAANQAIFDASNNATITVANHATIHSGATPNGGTLAGIIAGFSGTYGLIAAVPNPAVNGTVLVDNYGSITTAKSYGIDAYNWGNGNVTVIEEANTTVTVGSATNLAIVGIAAYGLGGKQTGTAPNIVQGQFATGDVEIALKDHVTVNVSAPTGFTISSQGIGVEAYNYNAGNVALTTSDQDLINAAGIGLRAINAAAVVDSSHSVTVNAAEGTTIHAGLVPGANNSGSSQGIVAGYNNNDKSTVSASINGNVFVTSSAVITAPVNGISAFNWGTGNVTVKTDAASNITASTSTGAGINASTNNGGSVSVTNAGTTTGGAQGINASVAANSLAAGALSVTNSGAASGSTAAGIRAFDLAGGDVSVKNTGATTGTIGINTSSSSAGNITIENNGQATATSGSGINANTTGSGNVTVITGTTSSSISLGTGDQSIGVGAAANDGGNINITNNGAAAGYGTGISAFANSVSNTQLHGSITIINNGTATSTGPSTATNIGIGATTLGGGDINITNNGIASGPNGGIAASAGGGGNVTVMTGAGSSTASGINGAAIMVSASATGTVKIDNSGTIGSNAAYVAINAGGGDIEISNSGSVLGLVFAIASGAGSVSIDNAGSVETLANGIVANASGIGNATITTTADSEVVAAAVGLGANTNGGGDALVTNHGSVSGAGGISVSASAGGDATVENTGSVTGTDSDGIGAYANGGNVTITNSGSVTGDNNGISVSASNGNVSITNTDTVTGHDGIYVSSNGSIAIDNSGELTGTNGTSIYVTSDVGGVDVTNTGMLKGAIVTDGNASIGSHTTISNDAGGIWQTDTISLGGGVATISVAGGAAVEVGSGTSEIANSVHVGALGTLQGAGTIHADLVNDGSVTASGGTLDIEGAVSGSGTWTVGDGATLKINSTADDNLTLQQPVASATVDLGGGNDSLVLADGGNFITARNIETVIGGSGNDHIVIDNTAGSTTTVIGGGGGDTITAGAGHDIIKYDATGDSLSGNPDNVIYFDAGNDKFDFSAIAVNNVEFTTSPLMDIDIAAHSIVVVSNGSDSIIYANASDSTESVSTNSQDMGIIVSGVTLDQSNLGSFILHP